MAKEGQGKDMAQQSARQDRENQHAPKCSKHAALIWTRSRYSHTGQRHANGRIKGRIHDKLRVTDLSEGPSRRQWKPFRGRTNSL